MRRIVTGHTPEGKSIFVSDTEPARVVSLKKLPGLQFYELWATRAAATIPHEGSDPAATMSSFVPEPGGTRFRIVRFPPDAEAARSFQEHGPEAVVAEIMAKIPGLAETHDPNDPRMHVTDTVDYGIVLSGEIWLELDDGAILPLKAGDCVVQNGTRHAWRNRSQEPVDVAFIMAGAERR